MGSGDSQMEIGTKLKNARTAAGLTQENAAEDINVSRQTISNWENEKSYPDIISVIKLSDLYDISLDELLKGDTKMHRHLDESTNIVKSNKYLIAALTANALFMAASAVLSFVSSADAALMAGGLIFFVISTSVLAIQIIRRF